MKLFTPECMRVHASPLEYNSLSVRRKPQRAPTVKSIFSKASDATCAPSHTCRLFISNSSFPPTTRLLSCAESIEQLRGQNLYQLSFWLEPSTSTNTNPPQCKRCKIANSNSTKSSRSRLFWTPFSPRQTSPRPFSKDIRTHRRPRVLNPLSF